MKIGFVNAVYQSGGAETVTHDLIEGCKAAGHDVRLYVALGKRYPRESGVVPLYSRAMSRLQHSRLQPYVERVAPRFEWTDGAFRKLASGWPDLVHVHSFHGEYARIQSLAYLAHRKPLVWTLHGHWGVTGGCEHPIECTRYQESCGECPRLGVWPLGVVDDTAEQLRAKVEYLGDVPLHVVAPSRFLAARVERSRVGRRWHVHHIPNGVSAAAFGTARKHNHAFRRALGLDPEATTILVVSRNFHDPQKGFPIVRDALAALPAGTDRVQVVLAGEGSEAAVSGLPPRLQPLGVGYVESRTKMAEFFEAADVFLFASPAENFPCVILEAMASRCCVVSTPTSGVTEQIDDGRTGILASHINGAELARALSVALAGPQLRRTLGAAARERVVAAFSIDETLRQYLALYETVRTEAVRRFDVHAPAAV